LICDGRLQTVVYEGARKPIGVGRASRDIPGWLRRQLVYRDKGCTFPGCGTRAFVDGHHVVHWEDGGPTDLGNLTLLCSFHHKLVHEFGWRVTLDKSDNSVWFRPNGRRYKPKLGSPKTTERAPPQPVLA
jgi:HNH endonuclease